MSTRRARIKAVTSLPPRRKNADNTEKSKAALLNEDPEKVTKSPRTPHSVGKESGDKPVRCTPALPPLQTTPNIQNKNSSPANRPNTPKSNVSKTPKQVSVITTSTNFRSVFASPPPRVGSPCRSSASPAPRLTPRINKAVTPIREKPVPVESGDLKEVTKILHEKENASTDGQSSVPDDYNIPSIPESITEEAVMDGIVPLQPTRSAPKPIDLLKNDIISENVEVNFDPIIPLPSPSKVRPKLRPIPRLAPLRRNSIQGSASESEDESRRALHSGATTPAPSRQRHDSHTSYSTMQSTNNREVNRTRNDSVCSTVSQAQPPLPSSPVKDTKHSKIRRQEMSKRMMAMRRRRDTVQRDTLTMYDLIFYNPTSNPIVPDQDEIKAKEANQREEEEIQESQEEDDPPAGDAAPVPQIKLGPNGEIVLDEKSLVIKQTESKRRVSRVVREGAWARGGQYSRAARTADWSASETVRFYRALAALGTDFSLMAPLFPDRTRRDLKVKFKKEEKVNGAQLDKALRSATTWDAVNLQEEFTREREEAARKAEMKKELLLRQKLAERQRIASAKEKHIRGSRGSRALENSILPSSPPKHNTANQIIQRAIEAKARSKRQKHMQSKAKLDSELKGNSPKTPYATITLVNKDQNPQKKAAPTPDMATISRIDPLSKTPISKTPSKTPSPSPVILNAASVPSNIESGSLVVLTVNDPNSPSKKMLQTYIAHGAGKLTPIALPPTFLNSVVGYMKKGTPKSSTGSPQIASPCTVQNAEEKSTPPSGVIHVNPSPSKKKRHSSYTITQL